MTLTLVDRKQKQNKATNEAIANMDKPQRTTLEEHIENRTTRREAIKGILAAGGAMTAVWCMPESASATTASATSTLGDAAKTSGQASSSGLSALPELPHVLKEGEDKEAIITIGVVEGYETQVLVSWGDPLFADVQPMDYRNPSAADQSKQFGYNNDFVAYMPIKWGSGNSQHGLLCVNNEFTNPELMFSGIKYEDKLETRTDNHIAVEAAATGHSVVEIKQDKEGHWQVIQASKFNRRITMHTEFEVRGPAAGNTRMKTEQDPSGRKVFGTVSNCSGGVTPWGTVLSGEENIHYYFRGKLIDLKEEANHKRMGVTGFGDYAFYRTDPRFDLAVTPNEPNRFGWIVEIDPYDPESKPVKRTALGRMRHEGAATAINHDGRVVCYTGDDERFEYLYKFVSEEKYDPKNTKKNRNLLDTGILYVARFEADGSVKWLPLVHGEGPLTWKNKFRSQADVLIETRSAADYLGATPMDRPEDVEENPVTRNVFVVLTNNNERSQIRVDQANPRKDNVHGHIIELEIPKINGKPDHAATEHSWSIFIKGGRLEEDDAWYGGHNPNTWLSCPDNIAFDNQGRLWIATDGFDKSSGVLDGVYACEVAGPQRALTKQFFHVPIGAELCGPCFTPDNSTLFVAVQHPGEYSTFDEPSTRWPNAPDSNLPPLPSVVAITKKGGGPIAG